MSQELSSMLMFELWFQDAVEINKNTLLDAISSQFGDIRLVNEQEGSYIIALQDHLATYSDGETATLLTHIAIPVRQGLNIPEETRQQMWDVADIRDDLIASCSYCITGGDMLGVGLSPYRRGELIMDYLAVLLKLYPECYAVYFTRSGRLMTRQDINSLLLGPSRYPKIYPNVRFYHVEGDRGFVMDSYGMALIGLADFQAFFQGINPLDMKASLRALAVDFYQDHDYLDKYQAVYAMRDGEMIEDEIWQLEPGPAFIGPDRPMISIQTAN